MKKKKKTLSQEENVPEKKTYEEYDTFGYLFGTLLMILLEMFLFFHCFLFFVFCFFVGEREERGEKRREEGKEKRQGEKKINKCILF